LLVWPDQSPEWRNVDRFPNSAARAATFDTFQRLDTLDPDSIGCEHDNFEPLPFLRFDDKGQALFEEWRAALEGRLRSDDLSPALESHLSKYRKLVPGLALIGHLADGSGPIGETALLRALAFAEYLETHARRAYGAASEAETASAKAILSRIRHRELLDGFTARDIYRRAWTHLSDREQVQAGLDLLVDLDWLDLRVIPTGGRVRTAYTINPKGMVR
jgi:putative DNA primase/helicase